MILSLFILGLVLFTAFSAFFSASETALFSLSSHSLKTYQRHTDPRKQLISRLLKKPRDLLVSILMMNILVNILVQNIASNLFEEFPGWGFKVGVPLLLTLLFGEIVPKSLAIQNNRWIAYHVAPAIERIRHILGPVRAGTTLLTTYIYRSFFFFLKKEEKISREELQHVLKTSKQHGVLHGDEARLVNGYLNLQEACVKELMQPREDVLLFDTGKDSLSHLIHLFSDQECSRLPVSTDGIDHIEGIITTQQYFKHQKQIQAPKDLIRFSHKPFYVPESMPARKLLKQLREREEEMALVVDEYGSVTGLITDEDLMEVVVGPIIDQREEKPRYTKATENIIIASGKLELAEFEEIFNVALPSENNMVTIGGWLTEQIGDIPKSGNKHVYGGFLFHVLSSNPNRVRRIYIRRLSTSTPTKGKE